jgi:hypothetical protein
VKALDALGVSPSADPRAPRLRAAGSKFSRDEAVAALKEYARQHNTRRVVLGAYQSWARAERHRSGRELERIPAAVSTFIALFGSWSKAVLKAGLVPGNAAGQFAGARADYAPTSIAFWLREFARGRTPDQLTASEFDLFAREREAQLRARGEATVIPRARSIARRRRCFVDALLSAGVIDELEHRRRLRRAHGHDSFTDEQLLVIASEAMAASGDVLTMGVYQAWVEDQLRSGDRDPREIPSDSTLRRRLGSMAGAAQAVLRWRADERGNGRASS